MSRVSEQKVRLSQDGNEWQPKHNRRQKYRCPFAFQKYLAVDDITIIEFEMIELNGVVENKILL